MKIDKGEQINDHLFMDTYKSNNIEIGVNYMTVHYNSEMCDTKRWIKLNTGDISIDVWLMYDWWELHQFEFS